MSGWKSDATIAGGPRQEHSVAAVGNEVYVIGLSGGASRQALRDSCVYEPWTDRWTRLAPMPAGTERGSAAMGVRGTKIYLAGSMRTLTPGPGGLQDTVDTAYALDLRGLRWTERAPMPTARGGRAGVSQAAARFYRVGR